MTTATATKVFERLQTDHDFAVEVHRLADDVPAVRAYLSDEGYDCSEDELREAFLERYGAQLTPEQLDALSGGFFPIFALIVGAAVIGVLAYAIGTTVANNT